MIVADRTELMRRLAFTAAAILVYCIGVHLPLPGLDPQALARITGPTVERVSILVLGITPYVVALALAELVKTIAPQLRRWELSDGANTRNLAAIVRGVALLMAAVQGAGISLALEDVNGLVPGPGVSFRLTTIATLVAGSAVLIWLADQITLRGIGSGAWLLFFAPTLTNFPWSIAALAGWQHDSNLLALELAMCAAFALIVFAATVKLVRVREVSGTAPTCLWAVLLAQILLPPVIAPLLAPSTNSLASFQLGDTALFTLFAVLVAAFAVLYPRSLRLAGVPAPSRAFSIVIAATLAALTLANLAVPAIIAQLMPRSGHLVMLAVVALSVLDPWWKPQPSGARGEPLSPRA